MQSTNTILMIRPVDFQFNKQTATNNAFQVQSNAEGIQQRALQEFDNFVAILRENDVKVMVADDTKSPHTPDSIFPNNWVSFHENGQIFLYPMFAENRRLERRDDIIDRLYEHFEINKVIDLSDFERIEKFLEGTGSMVLDRENKIAYACISPRTHKDVLTEFCSESGFTSVIFHAVDGQGIPIYHTNVMMCVGSGFIVICLDAIQSQSEREEVVKTIEQTEKELIEINFDQMNSFAGNMLEIKNTNGEPLIVMSSSAENALTDQQIKKLNNYGKIISAPIGTIESNGGGSARCMIAEIHLPLKETTFPEN